MKVLVVMCVVMLMGGVFGETKTALKLDEKLHDENRAQLIKEDRLKDNEALKEAERDSEKFQLSKDKGDALSIDHATEFIDLVKFNDFEDFAERNDLDKSNKLIVQIQDQSNHKESNAVQSSRGTSFDTKVQRRNNLALDSKIHENEDVAAASDSESQRALAKETAAESLLKDQSESLFGRGLNFEFLDFDNGFNGAHHDEDDGIFGNAGLFGGFHRGAAFDRFRLRGHGRHHF